MISALLVSLAALSPVDTPIEPIPVSIIQAGIDAGLMQETCDLYGEVMPIFAAALDGDLLLAMDITDAYLLASIENGWEPAGAALTLEASDALTDYMHDCAR